MREIKFRAWDGENMLKNAYCHTTPEGWIWMANSCKIGVRSITQYIGLKDKNGKDWYDGDIGDAGEPPANSIAAKTGLRYFEIVWDEKYAAFGAKQADGTISEINADWMAECENIGNIYENPELIK